MFTILFGVVVVVILWLMIKEKSGKPGENSSPLQLAEVARLKQQGYSVMWSEDGTAQLFSGHMKSLSVDPDGNVTYSSVRHRNKRPPRA